MQVLYPNCAGIDIHKKTAVVCCRSTAADGTVTMETRTFSTMTADLLALSDWLTSKGITHVAMESTGEFWNQGLVQSPHRGIVVLRWARKRSKW